MSAGTVPSRAPVALPPLAFQVLSGDRKAKAIGRAESRVVELVQAQLFPQLAHLLLGGVLGSVGLVLIVLIQQLLTQRLKVNGPSFLHGRDAPTRKRTAGSACSCHASPMHCTGGPAHSCSS